MLNDKKQIVIKVISFTTTLLLILLILHFIFSLISLYSSSTAPLHTGHSELETFVKIYWKHYFVLGGLYIFVPYAFLSYFRERLMGRKEQRRAVRFGGVIAAGIIISIILFVVMLFIGLR